jgi:glucose-6-phosphate 1-dehydrogenase
MDLDEFYRRETKYIKKNENDAELAKTFDAKLSGFKKISSYISGQYDTDEGFQELREHLEKLEDERSGSKSPRNRVFYMALPPSVFTVVAKGLKKNVYSESGKNRIIVEKPFGKDLESSREMMTALKAEWAENETYRIDHYLGKEMIKNMLVLRFGNVFLDACMNRNFISNVQITFKEPFGTEGRGGYFDEFGIIRDVCQNRERTRKTPGADSRPHADAVGAGDGEASVVLRRGHPGRKGASRVEAKLMGQVKVLRCIPPIDKKDVLLGQYVATGNKPGYLDDDTVPKGSHCPTFAAMVLWVNNPRWEGVPFIMKAGKGESQTLGSRS